MRGAEARRFLEREQHFAFRRRIARGVEQAREAVVDSRGVRRAELEERDIRGDRRGGFARGLARLGLMAIWCAELSNQAFGNVFTRSRHSLS